MELGGLVRRASGWSLGLLLLFIGCGARTELYPGTPDLDAGPDASRDAGDASRDAPPDVVDAAPDVPFDSPLDAPDAPPDAPLDAPPDSPLPEGCDASDSSILLLSGDGSIHRFYPLLVSSVFVGTLNCGVVLNSMTIDRAGTLYVNSGIGELYTADQETLNCTKTPFDASQVDYIRYGMGFTADEVPAGETLFIAPRDEFSNVTKLSKMDLTTYTVYDVGPLPEPVPPAEVKGTGDGRLYLVHMASDTQAARLVRIDKDTAALGAAVELPIGAPFQGFDFAYWGGAFYVFVSLAGEVTSSVIRYSPDSGALETLGTVPAVVVGAGVSTCAPL